VSASTSISELGFPEALRWHDGALYFSDMFRSRVMRWVPGQPPQVLLDADHGGPIMPGGLGWMPDGSLLVVDCLERRVLRVSGERVDVHADLGPHMSHAANDMHVDSDGSAVVGGYGFEPGADEPRGSHLLHIAADGAIRRSTETFVFPNGCERAPDGVLLVAETFADRVSRAEPGEARALVHLPPGSGPDGISLAPDGTLFIALAFGGTLVAVDAHPLLKSPASVELRVVHRPDPIANGPGAGPVSVYDCAVHPSGRYVAVAIASADEALAERVDTGRIELITL
jgi:sugar lactone lactonase YvrE